MKIWKQCPICGLALLFSPDGDFDINAQQCGHDVRNYIPVVSKAEQNFPSEEDVMNAKI